jgi:hypothetical protein
MNDRSRERQRASLHVALALAVRERDTLAVARAAGRLRVPGIRLTSGEFLIARRARTAVGRALVRARFPSRLQAATAEGVPVPILLRAPHFPIWRALGAASLALLVLLLLQPGGGFFGGGASEPAQPAGATLSANATLRGRTVGLASQVVSVATPQPTATAAVPGASPSAAPIGGSGQGSPAPGGGGGVNPTSPQPAGTPAVPPLGFGRLTVIVVDASNQPVNNVCVVLGTANCDANRPHTGADGKWSADIQLPAPRTLWDMYFIRSGYNQEYKQTELRQGEEVIVRITLTRA